VEISFSPRRIGVSHWTQPQYLDWDADALKHGHAVRLKKLAKSVRVHLHRQATMVPLGTGLAALAPFQSRKLLGFPVRFLHFPAEPGTMNDGL
jgi:hypothetical protein